MVVHGEAGDEQGGIHPAKDDVLGPGAPERSDPPDGYLVDPIGTGVVDREAVVMDQHLVPGCVDDGLRREEVAPERGVLCYRPDLPAVDRAIEDARAAGNDKQCPEDFKDSERMKDEPCDA